MAILSRRWTTQIFTIAFGVCSIAWTTFSVTFYRTEEFLGDFSRRILSGEVYSEPQLILLKTRLDATPARRLRSVALNDVAVIRLLMTETELAKNRQISTSDMAGLEAIVTDALNGSPTNSFMWLAKYWMEQVRAGAGDGGFNFLRMSYLFGPNEAWIGIKRNSVALNSFASLPDDLAEQVLAEFPRLVDSGLRREAANILAGPGWPLHEKLLGRLAKTDEANRRALAKALESKDIDGNIVPGLGQRPARPF